MCHSPCDTFSGDKAEHNVDFTIMLCYVCPRVKVRYKEDGSDGGMSVAMITTAALTQTHGLYYYSPSVYSD